MNILDLTEFIQLFTTKKKGVCKPGPDKCGLDLLIFDYDDTKQNLTLNWFQVKVGYSYNYVVEKEISILENKNVESRFKKIKGIRMIKLAKIQQKFTLITSKRVGSPLLKQLIMLESELVTLDESSKYLPQRVKHYIKGPNGEK